MLGWRKRAGACKFLWSLSSLLGFKCRNMVWFSWRRLMAFGGDGLTDACETPFEFQTNKC